MEYWLAVLDELSDQTGLDVPSDKRELAAGILQSASSVHSDYSAPAECPRAPVERRTPDRKQAWWEDVSQLSGSDWVLARQIHALIASRHA